MAKVRWINLEDGSVCIESGIRPEEATLMQCTGLKDKNGREIYEGDIVRREYNCPITDKVIVYTWVVSHEKGQWWLIFRGYLDSLTVRRVRNSRNRAGMTEGIE